MPEEVKIEIKPSETKPIVYGQTILAKKDYLRILSVFRSKYPKCFTVTPIPIRPLALGTHRVLIQHLAEKKLKKMSEEIIRKFLKIYSVKRLYQEALILGADRFELNGEISGKVTEQELLRKKQGKKCKAENKDIEKVNVSADNLVEITKLEDSRESSETKPKTELLNNLAALTEKAIIDQKLSKKKPSKKVSEEKLSTKDSKQEVSKKSIVEPVREKLKFKSSKPAPKYLRHNEELMNTATTTTIVIAKTMAEKL